MFALLSQTGPHEVGEQAGGLGIGSGFGNVMMMVGVMWCTQQEAMPTIVPNRASTS